MKAKIGVGIVAVVVGVFLIADWYVAGRAEREIDKKIQALRTSGSLPASLSYSGVSVSPVFGEVSVHKVAVSDEGGGVAFRCENLQFGLSISDAIALSKGDEPDDIHSFNLDVSEPRILKERSGTELSLDNLRVEFDGHITRRMIQERFRTFPDEDQSVSIAFAGLKAELPALYREMYLTREVQEKISRIDEFSIGIQYDARAREFRVTRCSLSTPIASVRYTAVLSFVGDGLENIRPERIKSECSLEISSEGLKWGIPDETGRYSLDRLVIHSRSEYALGRHTGPEFRLPKGNSSFLLEGFQAEFEGRLRRELGAITMFTGIPLENISIDKFAIAYDYDGHHLTISDVELLTPLLRGFLEAEVDIDERDIERSVIQHARLRVTDLSEDLEEGLLRLERQMGQSLPREGKDIVIEVTGRIGDPRIKGLRL